MRIPKQDIPAKIDIPGAKARVQTDFGDASGYSKMNGEYFSLGQGADIGPLLQGLEHNLCQCPHWGHIINGSLTVTYGDGTAETVTTNDLFYWPPGHTIVANEDTDLVLFSPQKEHCLVMDHMLDKLAQSQ